MIRNQILQKIESIDFNDFNILLLIRKFGIGNKTFGYPNIRFCRFKSKI